MENQLIETNKTLSNLKSSQIKLINTVIDQWRLLNKFNKKIENILEQRFPKSFFYAYHLYLLVIFIIFFY